MYHQHYLEAIEVVLAWDLPEELIPLAINDQAKLLAGYEAETLWDENLS